ncbi:hypothetical protein KM043_008243 [Ampulex compressa]|nr:hypothetical protein KM043_008243 [Ampulex compressa]
MRLEQIAESTHGSLMQIVFKPRVRSADVYTKPSGTFASASTAHPTCAAESVLGNFHRSTIPPKELSSTIPESFSSSESLKHHIPRARSALRTSRTSRSAAKNQGSRDIRSSIVLAKIRASIAVVPLQVDCQRLPKGRRLEGVRGGFGRGKVKAKGPRKRQEIKVWRAARPLAAGAIEATRPHAVQPCTNTDERQRMRTLRGQGQREGERKGEMRPAQSVVTPFCDSGESQSKFCSPINATIFLLEEGTARMCEAARENRRRKVAWKG